MSSPLINNKFIWMHDRHLLFNQQYHRKMGKVNNNKRKISRGGKFNPQLNSAVANALQQQQQQPMQTGISVVQSNQPANGLMNNSNLNNSVVSTNALTPANHPHNTQANGSPNLAASPPNLVNQSIGPLGPNAANQNLISLTSLQQTSPTGNNNNNLNATVAHLQSNQAANQLMPIANPAMHPQQPQLQSQQPTQNSTSTHPLNQLQASSQLASNHPLLDLQQMNTMANNGSNCPERANQQLTMINNPFGTNMTNTQCRLNSNLNNNNNDLNPIQPQHNSKCARLDTNDLNWTDLKPNMIKLENDLNSNSPNSNSSNNHSHNSSSSLESPVNCLLKNDLNVKLTGGYSSKSRNGKYELKILKQPEEQHR